MNEMVLEEPKLYFWLYSGKGLRSIRELANTLPELTQREFNYHVTAEKNDFANWIEGVFHETELASRLRRCLTKEEHQSILYNYFIHNEIRQKQEERTRRKMEEEKTIVNDPARFASYRAMDAKRKDELADAFDAVSRRFSENAHPATPGDVARRIESCAERHRELRQRIADARKAGKDPFIADLIIRSVPSKLEYARISHDDSDFVRVESLLAEAEHELEEALRAEHTDARGEVDALVKGTRRDGHLSEPRTPDTGVVSTGGGA